MHKLILDKSAHVTCRDAAGLLAFEKFPVVIVTLPTNKEETLRHLTQLFLISNFGFNYMNSQEIVCKNLKIVIAKTEKDLYNN